MPSLSEKKIREVEAFSKSCRHTIISMLKQSQSGHPGGSLSCIDFLSLLYTQVISSTKEKVVISNGHISPAVYSLLAELGLVSKKKVIEGFRKIGEPFEGHVSRHVRGVEYGTGPLGSGVSAASGFALAEKLKARNNRKPNNVYAVVGDGESQEGQVYEMMNFAHKHNLFNFIVFMDYNRVQLSDSLKKIMPLNPKAQWEAAGWNVIEVDGHDYKALHSALEKAQSSTEKPTLILGNTIMGKGVYQMERTGRKNQATWHGKAPSPEEADEMLESLKTSTEEKKLVKALKQKNKWKPGPVKFQKLLSKIDIKTGSPILYTSDTLTDCRSAYGKALLSLAEKNKSIVALTADLADSVKTSLLRDKYPGRHIECGVAEQQMVSASGGMSLNGFVPFCSTFGAFMTSRAKDQARLNDINQTNVKMVATHCGLSLGKDGPTHQAIDDMGSMLGLFNTHVVEPADPNHCDRIIRYSASVYGNFYIRMGREKLPVITKEDGTPFFGLDYKYIYGRCDRLSVGKDLTIAASGPIVHEAIRAAMELEKKGISVEIIIVSSPKKFDETLLKSIKKTKRLVVAEDHNSTSGFANQILRFAQENDLRLKDFLPIGVSEYQLSGTAAELYKSAKIDADSIYKRSLKLFS